MSDTTDFGGSSLPWRIAALPERVDSLHSDVRVLRDSKADDADLTAAEVRVNAKITDLEARQNEKVANLAKDMASVRNALYALAGGVVIAALVFAFTVLQLTGGGSS